MRSRRKALIFLGVKECETEDCKALVLNTLLNTMGLKDIASNTIKVCHRLGMPNKDRPRPILVNLRMARLHFGIRACWTQDGEIIIKPSSDDGDRLKITSVAGLNSLVARYPKKSGGEMSASSALSAKR
ncbi:hypothetical protein ACJJTC_000285 [Scirpophaga incertulas]